MTEWKKATDFTEDNQHWVITGDRLGDRLHASIIYLEGRWVVRYLNEAPLHPVLFDKPEEVEEVKRDCLHLARNYALALLAETCAVLQQSLVLSEASINTLGRYRSLRAEARRVRPRLQEETQVKEKRE